MLCQSDQFGSSLENFCEHKPPSAAIPSCESNNCYDGNDSSAPKVRVVIAQGKRSAALGDDGIQVHQPWKGELGDHHGSVIVERPHSRCIQHKEPLQSVKQYFISKEQ